MTELIHNDRPEHWCGLCRTGHVIANVKSGHIERLLVRCVITGVITELGASQILEELK